MISNPLKFRHGILIAAVWVLTSVAWAAAPALPTLPLPTAFTELISQVPGCTAGTGGIAIATCTGANAWPACTIVVDNAAKLKAEITGMSAGKTVCIQAGTTIALEDVPANYLRVTSAVDTPGQWLTIRSTGCSPGGCTGDLDTRTTIAGGGRRRVRPSDLPWMATISADAGAPGTVFVVGANTKRVRIIGLKFTHTQDGHADSILDMGDENDITDTTKLIDFDRVWVQGDSTGNMPPTNIRATNKGSNIRRVKGVVVRRSMINGIHSRKNPSPTSTSTDYGDTNTIHFSEGTTGVLIENNHLESSGENILTCGNATDRVETRDHNIQDMIFRGNLVEKLNISTTIQPFSQAYFNKNMFELKCGERILIEGNTLRGYAPGRGGQFWPIVFKASNQSEFPQQVRTNDITFRFNRLHKIARFYQPGLGRCDEDEIPPNLSEGRNYAHNNLVTDLGWKHTEADAGDDIDIVYYQCPSAASGTVASFLAPVRFEHNTIAHDPAPGDLSFMKHSSLFPTAPPSEGKFHKGNIFYRFNVHTLQTMKNTRPASDITAAESELLNVACPPSDCSITRNMGVIPLAPYIPAATNYTHTGAFTDIFENAANGNYRLNNSTNCRSNATGTGAAINCNNMTETGLAAATDIGVDMEGLEACAGGSNKLWQGFDIYSSDAGLDANWTGSAVACAGADPGPVPLDIQLTARPAGSGSFVSGAITVAAGANVDFHWEASSTVTSCTKAQSPPTPASTPPWTGTTTTFPGDAMAVATPTGITNVSYKLTCTGSVAGSIDDTIVVNLTSEPVVGPPGMPNPSDDATGQPLTPTLTWTTGVGATSHKVLFSTTNPPPASSSTATGGSGTFTPPGPLIADTEYFWQVISVGTSPPTPAPEAAGMIWSFRTAPSITGVDPPAPPVYTSPADASVNIDRPVLLDWDASARAVTYDVHIGTTSPPPLVVNVGTTSISLTTLAPGVQYFWKIVARNIENEPSTGGEGERDFTTRVAPIGCPSPPTAEIRGTITPAIAGAGSTINCVGGIGGVPPVTAAMDGAYVFPDVPGGVYTLTPVKAGFTFAPASRDITLGDVTISGEDFTASAIPPGTFTVSGTITPAVSGVGTVVSGITPPAVANGSGVYSFSNVVNGSYTLTPSKSGFMFIPVTLGVTVADANSTGNDFAASIVPPDTFTVSGTLSPAVSGAGATVALTGFPSVTANASGAYTFTGIPNGTYTITPTKTNFVFAPLTRGATVADANVTVPDFTATPTTFTVSGTITPAASGMGTTVALTGHPSVTASASGAYSFPDIPNGTYTVTPTKSGFTFTPATRGVTVASANITVPNFAATSSGGCPTASVILSKNPIKVGQNSDATPPPGWGMGNIITSAPAVAVKHPPTATGSPTLVFVGRRLTGVTPGTSTITGTGWTAPNGSTGCALNAATLTVTAPTNGELLVFDWNEVLPFDQGRWLEGVSAAELPSRPNQQPARGNTNRVTPINYSTGTYQMRVRIGCMAVNDEFRLTFNHWQGPPDTEDDLGEMFTPVAITEPDLRFNFIGNNIDRRFAAKLSEFNEPDGHPPFDWTRARDFLGFFDQFTSPPAPPPPPSGVINNLSYPVDIRWTIVAVTSSGTFAGWPAWIADSPDRTAPDCVFPAQPIITGPLAGASPTVSGSVPITAAVSDNRAITKVEWYIGPNPGVEVLRHEASGCTSPCTWDWNTTTLTNGSYKARVKVYDEANNTNSKAVVPITVTN